MQLTGSLRSRQQVYASAGHPSATFDCRLEVGLAPQLRTFYQLCDNETASCNSLPYSLPSVVAPSYTTFFRIDGASLVMKPVAEQSLLLAEG